MAYLLLVEADTLGAGKTSYAAKAIHHLEQQGFTVGGLLSVPVYEYRQGTFSLVGQDALLLPGKQRLELARVGRPDWEPRNALGDQLRIHPRLTEQRRHMNVNPRVAGKCLEHLLAVLQDPAIDAVALDEIGTVLGGTTLGRQDKRLYEWCQALPGAHKQAAVVTVQMRGQHRQHVNACVETIKAAMRNTASDYVVLDMLLPSPELPPALLELRPARAP